MRIAVITAAGQGTRVGHPLPKQFIKVGGSTIVEYSIKKFLEIGYDRVIVALPAKGFATYRDMLTDNPRVDYIPGGLTANESRYIGVSHAAGYIRDETTFAVVAVHDGVRPLFSPSIAIKCTRMCENDANRAAVVPYIETVETIRRPDGLYIRPVYEREVLWRLQTPMVFDLSRLNEAYERVVRNGTFETYLTASDVYEAMYHDMRFVESTVRNFKITTADDLSMAAILLTHE